MKPARPDNGLAFYFKETFMSRIAIRSTLAALGLAVAAAGFTAPAFAAPDADGARHDQRHHRGGKHGHHHFGMYNDGFMIPGVGPLSKKQVEALKLDASQKSAFDAARQSQDALRKSMREAGAQRHDLLKSQLADGKLDPRALVASADEGREQFRQQAGEVQGKWLAAWDTLNDGQRKQVAEWVKARHDKMQQRIAKMQERQAKRQERSAAQPAAASAAPAN